MSYASYLKQLCGRSEERQDFSEEEAYRLGAALLDGGVPELELGAVLASLNLRPGSAGELTGLHSALAERVYRLGCPTDRALPVVLPSYGGVRDGPNLLPLLAMLIARFGVPVLVHGGLTAASGVASVYVFRELGVLPSVNLTQAQAALDQNGIAFVPTPVLAPGLADLLGLAGRMGVRSMAHMLAKLVDPFDGASVRVVSATRPARLALLGEFLDASGGRALLLHAAGGEPVASAASRPRMELCCDGRREVLFEAESGTMRITGSPPPHTDARSTGEWTRQALAGEVPVPMPIVNQLACCLYAAGYTHDMTQAKAIVAVETGSLAAA